VRSFRYQDKGTIVHRLNPFSKLGWITSIIVLSLVVDSPLFMMAVFLSTLPLVKAARVWSEWLSAMRLALYLSAAIILINTLVSSHGTHVLFEAPFHLPLVGVPVITLEAIIYGGVMSLRLLSIISAFALLTFTVNPDDMMLSNWLSNELRNAMLDKIEGIDVMPFGDVRRAAGERLMMQCLQEIHDYGSIDPPILDELAKELTNEVKYAVAHRIETDQVEFGEDEVKENEVVTGYTLKTKRKITATFYVYDLQQSKRVCLATIEGNSETKRQITEEERVDTGDGILGAVVDIVDIIFSDDEDDRIENFPPPPNQDVVMRHIYNKFSEELPKKK